MAVKTHLIPARRPICGSTQTSAGWDFSSKQLISVHIWDQLHTQYKICWFKIYTCFCFFVFSSGPERNPERAQSAGFWCQLLPGSVWLEALQFPALKVFFACFHSLVALFFINLCVKMTHWTFFFSWAPSFPELLPGNERTVSNSPKQSQM